MNTVLTSLKEIKPRYIGLWFKDQLNRPDWFRNMVVDRYAWGVFSIYAHARRSDGKAKAAYTTKVDAEENALKMSKKYGARFVTYKCLFCDGWHVSKTSDRMPTFVEGKTPIEEYNPTGMNNQGGMDMEKILSLNIPDLAPVYGGLRGRTLSSARQYYAWRPLVDAGLRQIIDLRADYKSDAYHKRCEEFGISYYRYPVVRGGKLENEMADHFPELCALIDKGHFYIACAHGLHRTDIALCLYWVFYAADKGIAPPPIRGYREDKGLDTHKIMRALNGMYEYMAHHDGKKPMPIETFRKRKEIIKELSKIKLGTDRMTMSDEVRDKVVNVTGTDTDIVGYWRVVKVDLEEGTEFENEELFETRGEADASCEMCQKKWKEHAWDYREYLSMKYQVRFVPIEAVVEDKCQKLELKDT